MKITWNGTKAEFEQRFLQQRTPAETGEATMSFLLPAILNNAEGAEGDPGVDREYEVSIEYLSTGDVNFKLNPFEGLRETILMKPADQQVTSSTTLATDDTIIAALLANSLYRIRGTVWYSSSAVADFKFTFATGGSTVANVMTFTGNDGIGNEFTGTWGDVVTVNLTSTGKYVMRFEAVLSTVDAIDFMFQWSQNTSDASATKVLAGSTIEWVAEQVSTDVTLTCTTGTLNLTGQSVGLNLNYVLTCTTGTLNLTGNSASIGLAYTLTCTTGTLNLTGQTLTLQKNLLLDVYTGAAVAYGFTKLRTAYSGNCIKIRRASDNTTQDIGFSGETLDTAAIDTFCSGTTGFIHTIYDQSGNGNNLTQATAASQPQIYSGGVLTLNSMPRANFDGSNDYMTLGTNISCAGPWTSLFIGKRTASGGKGLALGGTDSSHGYTPWRYSDNTVYVRGDSGFAASSSTYTTAAQECLTGIYLSSGATVRSNGSSIAMGSLSSATSSNFVNFGARTGSGEYHAGDFQCLVLWLSDKTSNISAIETLARVPYGF